MPWPVEFDRGNVLGAIEEASGTPLPAEDSLPDMLIAKAQELGLRPIDLKLWIYDSPDHGWSPHTLESWARRMHLTAPLTRCAHCGKGIYTTAEFGTHQCDESGARAAGQPAAAGKEGKDKSVSKGE